MLREDLPHYAQVLFDRYRANNKGSFYINETKLDTSFFWLYTPQWWTIRYDVEHWRFETLRERCEENEPELLDEDESFSRDICDHNYPVWFVEGERVLAETRDKKREEKIYLCTVPWKAFSKHIVLDPDYIEEYKNWENYHWAYYDDIKKLPKTLDWTTKTIDWNEYILSLVK